MRAALGERDDLVVVNSCAVTAQAVKQARQAVRRTARDRPGARIVVTGCAAHTDAAAFAAMPEVAAVIGNDRKPDIAALFGIAPRPAPPAFGRRARGFVAVQNGCDHACTFCIVPATRGPSRSVPAGAIVDEVRALVAQGCREVVLTGIDLGGWGGDLPGAPTVSGLVERLLALVPELPRLRLSSLDPIEVDDRLVALFGDARLQPHLHLSLQAGADLILKRMRRRHLRRDAVDLVARLKAVRPDIAIGADLIAGFPTETEAQAHETGTLLDDCDIVHAHVFPYSPRTGTPAARMPQVEPAAARARAARLREAAAARRAAWLAGHVGTLQSVLVEGEDGRGHAAGFAPVRLAGGAAALGAVSNRPVRGGIAGARITHVEDGVLVGDPV